MMIKRATLSLATLLSAAAALVAASGCGSAEQTIDPVAQAAVTTSHAGGARIALTVTARSSALGSTPLTVTGTGDFNLHSHEGELLLHLEGLPAVGGAQLTELYAAGDLYLRSSLLEGKLPAGARWMKLDLAKIESTLGIDPEALSSGESDPSEYLDYLRAAGTVRQAGRGTIGGVPTTRYDATVDLTRLAQLVPSSSRAQTNAAIQELIKETGASSFPVSVWVDGSHLIRRMEATIAIPQGSTTVDYELSGFGSTPTVNPPAAGETFDATSLSLSALGSG